MAALIIDEPKFYDKRYHSADGNWATTPWDPEFLKKEAEAQGNDTKKKADWGKIFGITSDIIGGIGNMLNPQSQENDPDGYDDPDDEKGKNAGLFWVIGASVLVIGGVIVYKIVKK